MLIDALSIEGIEMIAIGQSVEDVFFPTQSRLNALQACSGQGAQMSDSLVQGPFF